MEKKINKPGFTIFELLVSVFLIAALSSVFFANYHSANKRTDVIAAANNLASAYRLAQGNSLGLVKYNGVVPAGGWGVHVVASSSSYLVFADLNDNMAYDAGEAISTSGGRTISLPNQISISSTSIGDSADVTFLPPNPETRIYNGVATSTVVQIDVYENINNSTKAVLVNFLGLIEVLE